MLITTEQAKEHLKINATLSEESFAPFIPDASEKYIKPFLGKTLFSNLEAWAETKELDDPPYLYNLYNKVIPVLARFTLLIAAPHLDVNIGESGFTVSGSATLVPASTDRVKRFTQSTEKLAWDNMETLLRFLEENKANYPEWVNSDAYTMAKKNLINSAAEFNSYVYIDNSRLTFHKLRSHIDNVEITTVAPLISEELYYYLIEKLKEDPVNISAKEKTLLNYLKACIANKVATNQLDKPMDDIFSFYFNKAREYINLHADDFPLYRDSKANDQAETPFPGFDNNEESAIFLA